MRIKNMNVRRESFVIEDEAFAPNDEELRKNYTVALCGNPNSGKTTIFNALTFSHQHVGNWPGVTVEKKEGKLLIEDREFLIVDLPGTYTLATHSIDERIARDYLLNENPDLVLIIIDQTNFERNMYFALEVLEMKKNTILVLNMSDEAEKMGMRIQTEGLSGFLGIPVVSICGKSSEGIRLLKDEIIKRSDSPLIPKTCHYDEKLESLISKISEDFLNIEHDRRRWNAIKLIEGEMEYRKTLTSDALRNIDQVLFDFGRDSLREPDITLAEARYGLIHGLTKEFLQRRATYQDREKFTTLIDRWLTHRIFGFPIFLAIMWLMFQFTFTIGGLFSSILDTFFGWLGSSVSSFLGESLFASFIVDGLIAGVGSVISFMPEIFFLFLFISFLGDIGYMSRAAFIMDKLMHLFGLHGKSFIPMILGFGCTIPAVMATRSLESRKDRIVTILVSPLMSCSARLPIYVVFSGIFFPKNAGTIIFSLYFLGIFLSVIMARLFKRFLFKGEEALFIMELPPYRLPTVKETLGEAWRKTSAFLRKAGTIIFAAVSVIWLLSSFPEGALYATSETWIGRLGTFIAPIFAPLGFGFWQAAVALIFGFFAKEIVVGALGTIMGGEALLSTVLPQYFSTLSAYSFMVFCLIYIPCVAAVAAIRKEAGPKWMLFSILYLFALAYGVSLGVYWGGRLLMG
jgi:ferrous iron transport protein B